MSDTFLIYYCVSFGASLLLLLLTPSKMSTADNVFGSSVLALFGFALWPLYLATFLMGRYRKRNPHG